MPFEDFNKCLDNKRLILSEKAKKFSSGELIEAENDLRDAQDSLRAKKYKWATVQAYYSVFHALRSLLYATGYRERSHWCALAGVEEIYVRQRGALSTNDIHAAHHTMNLREDADYASAYSLDGAEEAIANAAAFLKKAKVTLKR